MHEKIVQQMLENVFFSSERWGRREGRGWESKTIAAKKELRNQGKEMKKKLENLNMGRNSSTK